MHVDIPLQILQQQVISAVPFVTKSVPRILDFKDMSAVIEVHYCIRSAALSLKSANTTRPFSFILSPVCFVITILCFHFCDVHLWTFCSLCVQTVLSLCHRNQVITSQLHITFSQFVHNNVQCLSQSTVGSMQISSL